MERNKEYILADETKQFPSNPNATSPLAASRLVAKVNLLSSTSTPNRSSSLGVRKGAHRNNLKDYKQIIDAIYSLLPVKDITEFYVGLHHILVQYLDCSFTAYGLYNEVSGCINLKLIDKADNAYTSKVFKSDSQNPIYQSFITKSTIAKDNVSFLNLS